MPHVRILLRYFQICKRQAGKSTAVITGIRLFFAIRGEIDGHVLQKKKGGVELNNYNVTLANKLNFNLYSA